MQIITITIDQFNVRDARYISATISVSANMFIFNVIGPIRKFGRYIKADK